MDVDFFTMLKHDFKLQPIVVFDGGDQESNEREFQLFLKKIEENLNNTKDFQPKMKRAHVMMKTVFLQVLADLQIHVYMHVSSGSFGADKAIALLAKQHSCPVLG